MLEEVRKGSEDPEGYVISGQVHGYDLLVYVIEEILKGGRGKLSEI